MQPPTSTAAAAVTTPRHPMQKPPTPPSSSDTRRSVTPTTASAEPTPPPARSSSSSSSSHPSKPMNASPASSPLESQRVTALLDLNRILLQEVIALQTSGRASNPAQAPSPPQPEVKADGDSAATAAAAAAAAAATVAVAVAKPHRAPSTGRISFSKEYIEFVSLSLSHTYGLDTMIHSPPSSLFWLLSLMSFYDAT